MGFAELLVIALVGLVVIGPDKLPQTIKSIIMWINRIKRVMNDTRAEFEQQLGVNEIRREIHNAEVMESLKNLQIAQDDLRKEAQAVNEKMAETGKQISDQIEPEDEGLYGEQHANHPPQETQENKN